MTGVSQKSEATLSTSVTPPTMSMDEKMLRRKPSNSRAPYCMENTALHPMQRPMKMDVTNTMRAYDEPTAARASAPRTRPTMSVSATL